MITPFRCFFFDLRMLLELSGCEERIGTMNYLIVSFEYFFLENSKIFLQPVFVGWTVMIRKSVGQSDTTLLLSSNVELKTAIEEGWCRVDLEGQGKSNGMWLFRIPAPSPILHIYDGHISLFCLVNLVFFWLTTFLQIWFIWLGSLAVKRAHLVFHLQIHIERLCYDVIFHDVHNKIYY